MSKSDFPPGRIFCVPRIQCGGCNCARDVREAKTLQQAIPIVQEWGFVVDEERGWLCPVCAHKAGCATCADPYTLCRTWEYLWDEWGPNRICSQ
jgi:hypothetical protein